MPRRPPRVEAAELPRSLAAIYGDRLLVPAYFRAFYDVPSH